MYNFWKKFTLLGEIGLFIPILLLIFFVDASKVHSVVFVNDIAIFLKPYLFVFSEKQIIVGLLLGLCLFFQEIIGGAIKYFFFKPRPNPMEYLSWFEKVEAGSFPSLHSARTFCLFLFSLYYTNFYISLGFLILWILVAYSRVYLKKHFVIDIAGGTILAMLLFIFIIKNLIEI